MSDGHVPSVGRSVVADGRARDPLAREARAVLRRVLIVCGDGIGYPQGMAPTHRVKAYARGLAECGLGVSVLCLNASEGHSSSLRNADVCGEDHGVRYQYTCGSTVRPRRFWARRWAGVRGVLGAVRVAARRVPGERIMAVILYPAKPMQAILFSVVGRLRGYPVVADLCELPEASTGSTRAASGVLTVLALRVVTGVVAISHALEMRVRVQTKGRTPVLVVPAMVDSRYYRCSHFENRSMPSVVYTGTLNDRKDGVADLMRAFALVARENAEVRLVLVGPAVPMPDALAQRLCIGDRVLFEGELEDDRARDWMRQASVLALCRPSTPQTEAAFSTKTVEYLATGRPVVTTRTGELGAMLSNGVNAYVVPPGDDVAFAQALSFALDEPEVSRAVGEAGFALAQSRFDYRVHGPRIAGFLTEVAGSPINGHRQIPGSRQPCEY
jgi:glycosyltransferase involved in cell wall biosynthesis